MKRSKFWLLLFAAFIIPALFAVVAFGACGVGHGDCTLVILFPLLFPFALLFSEAFPNAFGILLLLTLAQFPSYVAVLAKFYGGVRYRLARNVILAAHVSAVVLAFLFWL